MTYVKLAVLLHEDDEVMNSRHRADPLFLKGFSLSNNDGALLIVT
ncbi:hypothetical protein [Paenibacillus massiliensis]|nr:hypothetical protein [Paenibacillus massiliensis]